MKRIIVILLGVAFACAGIGWAAYLAVAPKFPLSKYVPAGPLLYLEAKDFSSLLSDWNSSSLKKQWIQSSNYEVFSRSRLFLRLKGAGDQFAATAGLPPDMNFLSQVSGEHSVLALYDIGNLQFLYITYLPAAKSMKTTLWQTRAKFEPRNAGRTDFYLRRDPESKREVAFAISGDYLLLATREDLMASALQLMSGKSDRTVESERWWAQSIAEAGSTGDLRMVVDLEKLVRNGYFRTYWVQQNITDLSQYSAAVSDMFLSSKQHREERVLIRKKELGRSPSLDGLEAAAELARLVPDDAGVYVAAANPSADFSFALLENKLLAPHFSPTLPSQLAPQVQLTSGEQGDGSDLETRIDQASVERQVAAQSTSRLKELLDQTPILATLQVQSTERDRADVFVRIRSAVVLLGVSDWDDNVIYSALADFVQPRLTASHFGVGWRQESGYQQLDGLWPLTVAVRGKYLFLSDDPVMVQSMLSNFARKPDRNLDRKPADLLAGFNHEHERVNFARFSGFVDRPHVVTTRLQSIEGQPQFFSGNLASLSMTLADVSAEKIEVRSDRGKVRQTVTYEWSQ